MHMRCPCGQCPWHLTRVGLQEKRRTSPPPRPAQRRRVACNGCVPRSRPARNRQGLPAGQTEEASRRGLADPPGHEAAVLTWDITSPDTLAPSHLPSSATQAGSAAARAEKLPRDPEIWPPWQSPTCLCR